VRVIVGVGDGVEVGDWVGVAVDGIGVEEGKDVCVENGVIVDSPEVQPKRTNTIPKRRVG
jgi:hypothetical protein